MSVIFLHGYYYPSGGNVRIKANNSSLATAIGLTAEKIKKDETILGVTGTYEGSSEYNAKIMSPTSTDCGAITTLITEVPLLDISNVTHLSNLFNGCSSLTTIPILNTSNAISMNNVFNGCSSLTELPLLDTSNVQTFDNMCSNCSSLTTVPIFNTSSATSMRNMFLYSNNLSNDSLNNILAMCISVTSAYTRAKTLKEIGISSNNATKCTNLSNYQAFLDAGWTTGY